jgi:hypothetical protein
LGALKHLQKEAEEAQAVVGDPTELKVELADCWLLVLDASRRAGFNPMEMLNASLDKLEINKRREWPAPSGSDEPIEHVRGPAPMTIGEALLKGREQNKAIRRRAWPVGVYVYHGTDNTLMITDDSSPLEKQELVPIMATYIATDWELSDQPFHGPLAGTVEEESHGK